MKNIILAICLNSFLFACTSTINDPSKTTTDNINKVIDKDNNSIEGLPQDVKGYRSWLKMNNNSILPDASSPHTPSDGNKNVFVNQGRDLLLKSGQQIFPYPDKTIVIKEALNKTENYVELIAVMKKIAGKDLEHNDWEFTEYTRNSADESFRLAFKDGIYWSCHSRCQR